MTVHRKPFDLDAYTRRVAEGPCFVCATVGQHPDYPAEVVVEDEDTIAFLGRYPTLLGHTLVAPKRHVERFEVDLDVDAHLALQRVVHRVARALTEVVPTERMYVLSLGSQQGNAHLHWHVAPLPPGVPYDEQQFHALMLENGTVDVDDAAQEALAAALRLRLRS